MHIISKFHDYYDKIKAFGIDKTVVYNRKPEIIFNMVREYWYRDNDKFPHFKEANVKGHCFTFRYFVIGFCGKLYPVINILRESDKVNEFINIFDEETFKNYLAVNGIKYDPLGWGFRSYNSLSKLPKFFDPNSWKDLEGKFQEYKTPVFVYGRFEEKADPIEKILINHYNNAALGTMTNPCLQDFSFGKIKDPVSCFQEIYMYISGVLGVPAKPMVELSDKHKAMKAGHGDKYSFRKMPEERKKK